MPRFTFHLEDGARPTPEFVIDELPDSEAAFDFARRLLCQRLHYGKVEIIEGETPIGVLTR